MQRSRWIFVTFTLRGRIYQHFRLSRNTSRHGKQYNGQTKSHKPKVLCHAAPLLDIFKPRNVSPWSIVAWRQMYSKLTTANVMNACFFFFLCCLTYNFVAKRGVNQFPFESSPSDKKSMMEMCTAMGPSRLKATVVFSHKNIDQQIRLCWTSSMGC